MANAGTEPSKIKPASASSDEGVLDVLQILSRQRWLIMFLAALGLAAGVAYALKAEVWYESRARVLINDKSSGLSADTGGEMVDEDLLANHIELLLSRKIVGEALEAEDLMDLESIAVRIAGKEDVDAIDYVIDNLSVVKGGEGGAKTARTLSITMTHTDPADGQRILQAILKRYGEFLSQQVGEMMDVAMTKIGEAKAVVKEELDVAETAYMTHRQNAPMLFQGEGSSNIYQDKYRRLQDEMLDLQIQESTITTRLDRVQGELADMEGKTLTMSESMDKLALIDSESLERLGLFAGLQISASNSAEFKAMMPAKVEQARAEFARLLTLTSKKQELEAKFGASHPDVQDIDDQIQVVQEFINDSKENTSTESPFGDSSINPESLLRAYDGFLRYDLASLNERKLELEVLSNEAEQAARELIEHELRDAILRKDVERNEALFDGVVQQLRDVDIAGGLKGYLYEFLEVPRLGKKSWPSLPLCGIGGLMLGLFAGLAFAIANDVRDGRFRSAAEVDEVVGLPSLGRVGKLNTMRDGVKGLIASELSPDAEAFRLGRTMLLPKIKSGEIKSVGVTSPMQGDGKSTITSNFAASFSQLGLSTLVIDCDLRRPTVHRYFSVVPEHGLADILTDGIAVDDVIKATEVENVSVITAGASTAKPAELLQSDKLDELIHTMEERFDIVVVDLPPVLAVSDPVVVAPRIDSVVMVIRAANARRDEVVNSLRRIENAGGKLVGCFLNTFGAGKKFLADGGYYGYYESGYTNANSRTQKASVSAKASRPSVPSVPSEPGE